MRRATVLVLALGWASPAAAQPVIAAQAHPAAGPAPLVVTLSSSGDAVAWHWDLGDGSSAEGQTVRHAYRAGAWTATVTGTAADSVTAQAKVAVTAGAVYLLAPRRADYSSPTRFSGSILPARRGVRVSLYRGERWLGYATTRWNGSFRLRTRLVAPGPYRARWSLAVSAPVRVVVRPRLHASLVGASLVGGQLRLVARLEPAAAGVLRVRIRRGSRDTRFASRRGVVRVRLDTTHPGSLRILVSTEPNRGFTGPDRVLQASIVPPRLALGSAGPAVAQLAARLIELHYVAPRTASFSYALLDGVYAFEKVQGLPRTGIIDARTWAVLANPRLPDPRYASPPDHLEIDKPHQVLYVVRSSRIALIISVATAGIAGYFTPVGRFSIYRKVTGFDPSPLGTLFDPMYFTGGYAIHGNPSVPPYPASHGCVRVPMWVAPSLYATNPYGETVYVY